MAESEAWDRTTGDAGKVPDVETVDKVPELRSDPVRVIFSAEILSGARRETEPHTPPTFPLSDRPPNP